MNTKIILLCSIAAIAAVVYCGCGKETPIAVPAAKTTEVAEANFNSTQTMQELNLTLR